MSITLNTIEQIKLIGQGTLKTNLPELDPSIPGNVINTLLAGTAVQVFTEQKNIENLQLDFFPQTASGEFLDFWAAINGLVRIPASNALGNISASGSLAVSIPLGTQFTAAGLVYESTSISTVSNFTGAVTLTFSSGTVTAVTTVAHTLVDNLNVTIINAADSDYNGTFAINVLDENTFTYTIPGTPAAPDTGNYSSTYANIPLQSVKAGSDKNLAAGTTLTIQSEITNLSLFGLVNGVGFLGGSDLEDDESLRERVLLALAADRGVYTNSQIRLAGLTVLEATRIFLQNPSINFTTDGTAVTDRGVDGATFLVDTVTLDMTANGTASIFVGSVVVVSGANQADYNGEHTVVSVTATSITYEISGTPIATATGTILLNLNPLLNIPIPGIVFVFVLDDNNLPPTPNAGTLTDVKNAILPQLPAHSTEDSLVVSGATFVSVDITITGLNPNSSTMQTSIEANLAAFFQDSVDFTEDVKLNEIITAIQSTQDSETGDFIEGFVVAVPSADVAVGNGSIGVLGTVSIS